MKHHLFEEHILYCCYLECSLPVDCQALFRHATLGITQSDEVSRAKTYSKYTFWITAGLFQEYLRQTCSYFIKTSHNKDNLNARN